MTKRIVLGLVMIVALAGLLYGDWHLEQLLNRHVGAARTIIGMPLAALVLILTVLAFVEVARLAAFHGVLILLVSGIIGAEMLATFPFWWQLFVPGRRVDATVLLLILALMMILAFLEQMIRYRTGDALRRIAHTFFAMLYLGVGGAIVLSMRVTYGIGILALFLVAVKSTDIGAYFVGSAIGKHKLIAWLSPGKTWEGLLGGLVSAAGISVLFVWALHIREIELWQAAVFGAIVGLAGQFADLCESLLKRSANIKDSGSSVPGFGGVLDIIDSPLLAAPFAQILLSIMA